MRRGVLVEFLFRFRVEEGPSAQGAGVVEVRVDGGIDVYKRQVWGFSGFTDSKFSEPKKSMLPSIRFDTEWWKDASMYFAVLQMCIRDSMAGVPGRQGLCTP